MVHLQIKQQNDKEEACWEMRSVKDTRVKISDKIIYKNCDTINVEYFFNSYHFVTN